MVSKFLWDAVLVLKLEVQNLQRSESMSLNYLVDLSYLLCHH